MEFIDDVRMRSARFSNRLKHPIDTEEATKNAFVLPFIQMLGYDFFDPSEVVPEFTADVGIKKGEKVDYALMQNGAPAVLIESKRLGAPLNVDEMSQLLRYFSVTKVRVGILTNGITYRFFSDLDQPNVMDTRPFFEFNMLDFTEPQVAELKRFRKSEFQIDSILAAARELKHTTAVKRVLAQEFAEPSEDFVTLIIRQVHDGKISTTVRKTFDPLVRAGLREVITEQVNARLKSALERGAAKEEEEADEAKVEEPEFTPREVEALSIIKAVVAGTVDVRRIGLRPSPLSYSHVVLSKDAAHKDTGRAICRIWVRDERDLRIRLVGNKQQEHLDDLESIYDYADGLRRLVLGGEADESAEAEGEDAEKDQEPGAWRPLRDTGE